MTTISFRMEGERVVGFTARGHSGFAAAGEDIVCAAITSAVQMTHALLYDVQKIAVDTVIEDEGAHIRLTLPARELGAGQDGMKALRIFYTELAAQYPEFLSVMEVQKDA